ncbi:bifunctional alpha/beta hydrolase/OsmC family protein [Dyadobacter tibetensis]|uniref:bifunctional alpha/beta hydrolase/OsmC family protein n=1 Tax=Dyadobacter tibetensis TaxID=1211851 RepID=UPI00046F6701|nr:bifunctional alpha/beta hydrolase/OsmC family protein [Dyadobacter tibetensis]
MKSENIVIKNRRGHSLNAYLELPANQKPNHIAIFAHCFTCNSNFNAVRDISRSLTNHGFGVVRFDFTGLGKSSGAFSESHFSANVSDLLDVHQYLKDHYQAPKLLVGHSLGGAAVLVAASQLKEVEAIATIGAPARADHVKHLFTDQLQDLDEDEEATVSIGGRPFHINGRFIKELEEANMEEVIGKLRKPLLILHAPFDKTVGIENAQQIYELAHHPKSYISLDGADHLLSKKEDSTYVGDMIGMWVNRYIPQQTNQMLSTEGEQLVAHLNLQENNFTTNMQTAAHALLADEPASVGGDDFGPSPYDFVVAGLAACTAMTVKLYAERKKWALEEIFVYVTHDKKHKDDLNEGNEPAGFLDHITKKLKFVGDLDESQRLRLVEIASKCPVHKTLENQVAFDSELIKAED